MAAVVSLLAQTKQVYTQADSTPARKVFLLSTKRCREMSIYTAMVAPAIRLRIPATAKPFQGISLMKMPAMLHSVAQTSISMIARFSFFMICLTRNTKGLKGVLITKNRRVIFTRLFLSI